jgi:prephenate dehydrogenase
MQQITIIGFGRFGKTLYRLVKDDFAVTIFTRSEIFEDDKENLTQHTTIAKTLEEAFANDTVFYAVPIVLFEEIIQQHQKYFEKRHVLIDVLSIKMHPQQVFEKYVPDAQVLLTHPMFGPDSSKNGFEGLPIILDKFKTNEQVYAFWKEYFQKKNLRVIEMSAEQHDELAAKSQGLTHFIGRLLEKVNFESTEIDSLGTKKLHEVKEQTCNDTWELFIGLQTYNPFTRAMRLQIGQAYSQLYNQLLPKQVNPNHLIFGIQGGMGSFNEEALQAYITKKQIEHYKTEYLFTTEKVLKNLHEGNIDFGLFAISNSTGGLVEESIQAMAKYRFSIVEDFTILIRHFLMKRKDVKEKEITTIMAHSQVFKQCEKTLREQYPHLTLVTGENDLMDTAKAAEELAKGNLPKTTAILGPKTLATHFGFNIIAEELQDKKDNLTRFLLVTR